LNVVRRRGVLTVPLALVLFVAVAVLVKLPVWTSPLHQIQGSQDAQQTIWFLTWTPFAIGQHHNPLISTYLNHPNGVNLMWNTAMPALGVLLWPFTVVGNAVLTYNVVTTAALAVSAFFGFLAIRRYVHGDVAAAIGGLVFGFSPGMIAQDPAHANVVASAITIPLAFMLLDELLVRQRMRAWVLGVLIAALGILQFFIFTEFFATEVIIAVVVGGLLALLFRAHVRERLPYTMRALTVAAGVALVVLAYPLYLLLAGPDRVHGSVHDPNGFSTDLLNPFVPTGVQALAPAAATAISINFSGNGSEANGYLGIPLLLLLIVMFVRFRHVAVVRVATLVAVAVTVLSLGPNLHIGGHQLPVPLPWWVPGHVPLLRSIIPARLMYFTYLACALVLAYALHRLWSARRNVGLTAGLAGVVLAPLVPALPLTGLATVTAPAFFTSAAVKQLPSGTPVLAVPWPSVSAMDGMNWQAASNMRFRLLGGYFIGPASPNQEVLRRIAQSFSGPAPPPDPGAIQMSEFVKELHDNNVGAIVVGSNPQQAAAVAFFTSLLGTPPRESEGVDVWLISGST
jgi:hypothetical protein